MHVFHNIITLIIRKSGKGTVPGIIWNCVLFVVVLHGGAFLIALLANIDSRIFVKVSSKLGL